MYTPKVLLNTIVGNFLFGDKEYQAASYEKLSTESKEILTSSVILCHNEEYDTFIPCDVLTSFLDKDGTINIAVMKNDLFPEEYTEDLIMDRKFSTFHLYYVNDRIFCISLKFIGDTAIFKTATFEEEYQDGQYDIVKTPHCARAVDVKDKQQYLDMIMDFIESMPMDRFREILKEFDICPHCYQEIFFKEE